MNGMASKVGFVLRPQMIATGIVYQASALQSAASLQIAVLDAWQARVMITPVQAIAYVLTLLLTVQFQLLILMATMSIVPAIAVVMMRLSPVSWAIVMMA
ncbi:MAG: hypothetical protein DRH04_04535 [Deltaproteobacteria bacterium]|nr:MAG: hypothetical protein DRH04_04535 [Deltaproteobacteria bacterium]